MNEFYDPYAGQGIGSTRWLKSQFHMHNIHWDAEGNYHETLDGMREFFDEYKAADYDLVVHASHNGWLDTSHLDADLGIRSFNGEEYVDFDGILLVGSDRAHRGDPQAVIDECRAMGGFAIICHPNQNPQLSELPGIPPLLTKEMSRPLTGAIGVEIYTGCLARRQRAGIPFGLSLATDYWDEALTSGRLLWGFATDDSHRGFEINTGWTDILSERDDFASVKQAIERGAIVASRGLRLLTWQFDGAVLTVEADLPYVRTGQTQYRFIGEGGRVLAVGEGATGTYRLTGHEAYVRVEARNADGSVLWTQPLLSRDHFTI